MKKFVFHLLLALIVLTGCKVNREYNQIPNGVIQNDYSITNDLVTTYEDTLPTVVTIEYTSTLIATGMIYSKQFDGTYFNYTVLTAWITSAKAKTIIGFDNFRFDPIFISGFAPYCLAIYQFKTARNDYEAINIGNASAENLAVGQQVYMISTIIFTEFNNSLFVGQLSGLNRLFVSDLGSSASASSLLTHQVNIPLNSGSFGAPVFNMNGDALGMMCGNYSEMEGTSFFIPIDQYQNVINTLITTKEYKKVVFGIQGGAASDFNNTFQNEIGYYIYEVVPSGNFAKAGITSDSLLTIINHDGHDYLIKHSVDMAKILLLLKVGDSITITYYKTLGAPLLVTFTLE